MLSICFIVGYKLVKCNPFIPYLLTFRIDTEALSVLSLPYDTSCSDAAGHGICEVFVHTVLDRWKIRNSMRRMHNQNCHLFGVRTCLASVFLWLGMLTIPSSCCQNHVSPKMVKQRYNLFF